MSKPKLSTTLYFLGLIFSPCFSYAVEFAQEQFLIPHSVAANGTALLLQSDAGSPMGFLDWPGSTVVQGLASLEASSQPIFGGLSQATLGAAHYSYDADTRIYVMTGILGTEDIPVRPLLQGTREERLNRPEIRPNDCPSCGFLQDRVYLGAMNAQRTLHGFVPRSGIASQPIPLTLSGGFTAKYFWEELEGDDYQAQALNVDGGLQLDIGLSYDPVLQTSERDLMLQFAGFELLPTALRSEIGGYVKEETGERRWHVGLSWRELWPSIKSTTVIGITQRSEGWRWPGFAAEWNVKKMFFLRAGFDGQTWASGASFKWKMLSAHYAMQKHPLGITWYQVAIQAEWPDLIP